MSNSTDPTATQEAPPMLTALPSRPHGIEPEVYLIATTMTVLPLIAIGLRFYARSLKKTGLSWDDFSILPAMVFTVVTAVFMYIGTAKGDLGKHTYIFEGQPIYTPQTKILQKVAYATIISSTLSIGFTKFSVLFFYKRLIIYNSVWEASDIFYRIFQGARFNLACWIMIGLIFMWTIGFTFANIFQCFPISINWNGWGVDPARCIDTNRMTLAQAWSDVFTNLVILILPLGCIWELQMPFWKKIAVAAVFLLGALTVGFGIAKLVVYYQVFHDLGTLTVDFAFEYTPFVYWPMIESGVGIIGACLPLMRPLISGASSRGFMRNLRTFNGTTSDNSNTFWEHSDNTALRDEWNNSVATTNFGSASQASTKMGGGSMSTMKWGTESLSPMTPNHQYPGYDPTRAPAAVPMKKISKLGVLDDDDLDDDYPLPAKPARKQRDMV